MNFLLVLLMVPNLVLTPGVTRSLSKAQICSIKWGADRRHVTDKMKRIVFANYSIPWKDHNLYEVDHLISRELGGADDVKNLWPQIWPEARMKDKEENQLHNEVCAGKLTLSEAQDKIKKWGR